MFIGEYKHTIDAKKRLSLPVKFRKEVGKNMVITRGFDNCLYVYPTIEWKKVADKLRALSMGQSDTRGFTRFMLSGALDVTLDSLGRILVPDFLREFAQLKSKVVVVGINDHIEIWNDRAWDQYKKRIEKQADVLAEKLGEIGAI